MPDILTITELRRITGHVSRKKIIEDLQFNNVPYFISTSGYISVFREHIMTPPTNQTHTNWEPKI